MIDVSMKIIGVISLDNISNIGDDILGDITEFIINNTGTKVRRIHFIGEKKNKFLILVTRILAAIAYGLFGGNFRYKLIYQNKSIFDVLIILILINKFSIIYYIKQTIYQF